MVIADQRGEIVLVNSQTERLFGYYRAELLGQAVEVLIPHRFRANHPESSRALLCSAPSAVRWVQTSSSSRLRKDGSEFPVEISLSPLETEDGILVSSSIRDITERKRAESELSRINDELRRQARLIDAAHDAILIRTIQGEISFWNQGAERMYGWSKEEAVGRISHELLSTRFPTPLDEILDTLVTNGSWEGELIHKRSDGSILVVASRWVIDRERWGTHGAILEMNNDITERRRAEAEAARERHLLSESIASAPVAIAIFDNQMRYLAHSTKWITDYRLSENWLLGRSHYEIFPELPEQLKEIHRRCLAGETLAQDEDVIHWPDGLADYVRWAVHPWRSEDGGIGGIVIASDIINELVRAREAALENSRLKSEFLANMSHEIRTPMNGVIGMTSLLWETDLDPEQKDCVMTIRDSGQALMNVINDILDFSKIESGKLTLEVEEFNLRLIMEDVADLMAPTAHEKQLELDLRFSPDVGGMV